MVAVNHTYRAYNFCTGPGGAMTRRFTTGCPTRGDARRIGPRALPHKKERAVTRVVGCYKRGELLR